MARTPPVDLLIEMGIREVWTQCRYAEVAYSNIKPPPADQITPRSLEQVIPAVFNAIHSFLSHCGVLSHLLTSKHLAINAQGKPLLEILGLPRNLRVLDRAFRNSLEHYDERLAKWINDKGPNVAVSDNNIGPKSAFGGGSNRVVVRNYDPKTFTYTLIDEDLDLRKLFGEVQKIKGIANAWVNCNT